MADPDVVPIGATPAVPTRDRRPRKRKADQLLAQLDQQPQPEPSIGAPGPPLVTEADVEEPVDVNPPPVSTRRVDAGGVHVGTNPSPVPPDPDDEPVEAEMVEDRPGTALELAARVQQRDAELAEFIGHQFKRPLIDAAAQAGRPSIQALIGAVTLAVVVIVLSLAAAASAVILGRFVL